MSGRERQRLVELESVARGEQRLSRAAERLGVSYRQAKRLWRRYREQGDVGLVHRSRGRPSNRRLAPTLRERCLEICRSELAGFGPTLAAELLEQRWQLTVDHETLRRWLQGAGLWQTRRRRSRHRRWRPRKEHFGEMLQLDGSEHDWFGRGERDCLLCLIDDATGRRMSRLASGETTHDALSLLLVWVERYGAPRSLYVDRKSVYWTDRKPTIDEELAGQTPATAFGRVCRKLGIEIIPASSPQAKGRIERSHAVYQDRLVKRIRLDGLDSYDAVNAILGAFDEDLCERFAVPPASDVDRHRAAPKKLVDLFVLEHTRTVQNDWTVRFENRWYQITGPSRSLPPARASVEVLVRLDGSIAIHYRGRAVHYQLLPERPRRPAPKPADKPANSPPQEPKEAWRPAPDHPWRSPISRNAPALRDRLPEVRPLR
jgi:transposase